MQIPNHMPLTVALAALLAWAGPSRALSQERSPDALRKEVLTAWALRRTAIKSCSMVAEVQRFIPGSGAKTDVKKGDPLAVLSPRYDLTTRFKIEYKYADGKSWLRERNERQVSSNPDVVKPQTILAAFEGRTNRRLIIDPGAAMSMGEIDHSNSPCDTIAVNTMLVPLMLWRDPEAFLQQVAWQFDRLTLEDASFEVDGLTCYRFRMPRRGGQGTSTLDLDPNRGWLPIQWERYYEGALRYSSKIEYEEAEPLVPKIKSWQSTNYTDFGALNDSERAEVKNFEVNAPIDDEVFNVEFPEGSHISEKIGNERRYFVQRNGRLECISEDDYGDPGK